MLIHHYITTSLLLGRPSMTTLAASMHAVPGCRCSAPGRTASTPCPPCPWPSCCRTTATHAQDMNGRLEADRCCRTMAPQAQGIHGRPDADCCCRTMAPKLMRQRSRRMVTSMDAARESRAASARLHLQQQGAAGGSRAASARLHLQQQGAAGGSRAASARLHLQQQGAAAGSSRQQQAACVQQGAAAGTMCAAGGSSGHHVCCRARWYTTCAHQARTCTTARAIWVQPADPCAREQRMCICP